MKTKIFTLMVAAFVMSNSLMAQKNVVKVRPLRPVVQLGLGAPIQLPLSYERVIIPRLTGAINFTYSLEGTFDPPFVVDFGNLSAPTISGWQFGPEVRFYPNISKDTPRGLYVAGFLDISKNNYSGGYTYKLPTYGYSADLGLEGDISRNNYGLALGTQKIFGKIFCIDVKWISLAWGGVNSTIDVTGDLGLNSLPIGIPADLIPNWENAAESLENQLTEVTDFPILNGAEINVTGKSTNDGAIVEYNSALPAVRLMNFSIGIAF